MVLVLKNLITKVVLLLPIMVIFCYLMFIFPMALRQKKRHLFKQEFLKRFSSYLQRLMSKGKKLIVLGDYNTAYLEWDVFDPQALKKHQWFFA